HPVLSRQAPDTFSLPLFLFSNLFAAIELTACCQAWALLCFRRFDLFQHVRIPCFGISFIEVRQEYLPMKKDTAKRLKGQIWVIMSSDYLGVLCVLGGLKKPR